MKKNFYLNQTTKDLYTSIHKFRIKDKSYGYWYSDLNFAILGEIIAKVCNQPYDEMMLDFLQNNLNLQQTFISGKITPTIDSYYRTKNRKFLIWNEHNPYAPAGAIITSLKDSLLFLKYQIYQDFPFLKLQVSPYKKIVFSKQKMLMGLSWFMFLDKSYLFHKGGTACYRSNYVIHLKKKIGITILSNTIGDKYFNPTILSMKILKDIKKYLKNI